MKRELRASVLVALAFGGCVAPDGAATSSTTQAVTSSNGIFQNGLTTNGVYQNGVYQNGVYQNGVYQNGVYQNGVYQNGVYQNGVYQNGVYQNGVYQNGVYQNGVYQNGVYQNGAWQTGLWSSPVWATGSNGNALSTNPYTRQFIEYVYACAMPPSTYDTSLDPNNGTMTCGTSVPCPPFYECSAQGTCVVPLRGAIGVGVNADGTTWGATGRCDESCQRWVSACVLARTNAYGVHVDISMRAPDDAPQAIKDALAVTSAERAAYTLREGAYFGNIFAQTPTTPPPTPVPPATAYSGPPSGPVAATPQFYACAGPGSNIPEITKRFCSSQGDQAVIKVPGVCLPTGAEQPVCSGEDTDPSSPTFGAIHDCYTSTDWTGLTPLKEVITVYLKQPISVCGNAVCEAGESDPTSPGFCPSDCHTGSWARSVSTDAVFGFAGHLAVDPSDGTSYLASNSYGQYDVTVDNTVSPPVVVPADPTNINDRDVVVKYAADGTLAWAHRYAEPAFYAWSSSITTTVAPDHTLVLAGTDDSPWVERIAPDGTVASAPTIIGAPGPGTSLIVERVRVAASGDILVAGEFYNGSPLPTATFGATTLTGGSTDDNIFVVKLSPQGQAIWAQSINAAPTQSRMLARALTVDAIGDVYVAGYDNQDSSNPTILAKLGGTDGAIAWVVRGNLGSLEGVVANVADPTRSIYVTGGMLTKLAPDGTVVWQRSLGPVGHTTGASVDPAGNVVLVAEYIWPIDFGAGVFTPYAVDHLAAVSYATDGTFRWAKHIPTILGAEPPYIQGQSFAQLATDANGRVFVAGGFAGSMQIDDRMLVARVPETKQGDTFIGSFVEPPATAAAPLIGAAMDQTGLSLSTIPAPIVVEATSAAGATVWFMAPTAIDNSGSGTNVTCSPAPNSTFAIGTTTVTCTATNALGKAATAQFTVTVRDTLAPSLSNVPADTTSSTSVVTFALPTANDQVDGPVPVTCSPASGSSFPVGLTTVTCTASDTHNNTVQGSFKITVTRPADTTPPVITVPGPMTVAAVNAAGAVVTYAASATDDTAVASFSCSPASGSQFPLGTTTVVCNATDTAGNAASASFTVTVKDLTPPVVTVPANITAEATGPSGATVAYSASATDNVDGAIVPVCTPPSGGTFALGTTTVSCAATDHAGNTGTAKLTITVRDTTPPTLTLPANITATATQAKGAAVSFNASASDLVDGAVATTCTPSSGSLFALGPTTVTCSATDAHGNKATGTFLITVTVSWGGLLAPIQADGSSVFQLGSVVPVRFALTGASAGITNIVATVTVTKTSSSVSGTHHKTPRFPPPTTGTTAVYAPATGHYRYRFGTTGLTVGTYQVKVDFHDGVTHAGQFSLDTFSCPTCENDGGDD